ncbi:3-hydroxyisobutyrate dehydrogenase [Psychrobacter pygoscelis]|uniref:3-hydroxyisobutyrate dehydrogenase n=1 Tax=Psychrobacter pygoscelis TaxID=2488563 RepID=UPI00103F13B5|nr:3-hydroxyisobutyrate dehydrogenase [Psychrobacter pygoscelis]
MTSSATETSRIAFIGLGNMGAPMAKNLVSNGFDVTVFDLAAEAKASLSQTGAKTADSPKQAAAGADVVITMLPAGKHVKSVYLGDNIDEVQDIEDAIRNNQFADGLLASLAPGTIVIDSSTIAAADARAVAKVAEHYGLVFLDAPVSGGTAGATAGTLTFIVGGDKAAFEQAKPILTAMGKNIFHAGDHGAGQVAKICNNMLLGILMSGTAEALNLGIKNGLDAAVLSDIMLQSSGRNWTLEVYNPYPNVMDNVPASRGYTGGFMSAHMHKDLHLALQTANDTGVEVPMGRQATELYDAHIKSYSQQDFSSIMGIYEPSVLS